MTDYEGYISWTQKALFLAIAVWPWISHLIWSLFLHLQNEGIGDFQIFLRSQMCLIFHLPYKGLISKIYVEFIYLNNNH